MDRHASRNLTGDRVCETFNYCKEDDGDVAVETIKGGEVAFNSKKLVERRMEIKRLLDELPECFSEGGGAPFTAACMDRRGRQWCDAHEIMEQLFLLGIATRMASLPLTRTVWNHLPEKLPYVSVHTS